MKKCISICFFSTMLIFLLYEKANAIGSFVDGWFVDTQFQGDYTTANLDRIIAEYQLNSGWFWTTKENTNQGFSGTKHRGWTDTSVKNGHNSYDSGWYGCRWGTSKSIVQVTSSNRNPSTSRGECFGFAEFIGYLLSGNRTPQLGSWKKYTSIDATGGLKPGDIIRIENSNGAHSAVVYSVNGDTVKFLQASGGYYNKILVKTGFYGAKMDGTQSISKLKKASGLKVYRSYGNIGGTNQVEIEITDAVYPHGNYGSLPYFGLRGIIKTSGYLTKVEGRLFNLSTKENDQYVPVTFSGTTTKQYDIKNEINNGLVFGGMEGYYEYEVVANYNINGEQKQATLVDSFFTIGNYILLTGLDINESEVSIKIGDSLLLSYSYSPSNASNNSVSWESSNENVVSVSSEGLITGMSLGEAIINCVANDGSGIISNCIINVYQTTPDIEIDSVMTSPDLLLPSSLTIIEDEAFAYSPAAWVKLSEHVTTIGYRAFGDCHDLTQIYIPPTATSIHPYAFENVPQEMIIFGEPGSEAETFAYEHGFDFRSTVAVSITEYRYRDSNEEYSDWVWGDWTTSQQTISNPDTMKEESKIQYGWWAAKCNNCAQHNPKWGSDLNCKKCGKALSRANITSVYAYSDDIGTTQNILGRNGGRYFNSLPYWRESSDNDRTVYRYATRTAETVWSSWSAWSSTRPEELPNREIEERTLYYTPTATPSTAQTGNHPTD